MNIQLIEVGRGKVTRIIEVPDGSTPDQIAEDISQEASRHLISREIDVTWNSETGEGTIFAGFHSVGKAKLVTKPSRPKVTTGRKDGSGNREVGDK